MLKLKEYTLAEISYLHGSLSNIDNEALIKLCLESKERWSDDPTNTKFEDLKLPINKELNNVVDSIMSQYLDTYQIRLNLEAIWAQVHHKYESTNIHNHATQDCLTSGPDISGVYYIQIPKDAGKLVFVYNTNQYQTRRTWIHPIVGDFYMFPASLNHFVTKNLSEDLRIAVSFNFSYEK